ncbi:hypothetical protein [Numidum massiliense]|uniref:hypothetical protein n=1 Tax=Numidum massiliense TaxID=1522315 RepID=UPI00164DD8F2|nr:hypothetical protein [Numidum massiliense]
MKQATPPWRSLLCTFTQRQTEKFAVPHRSAPQVRIMDKNSRYLVLKRVDRAVQAIVSTPYDCRFIR